MDRLIKLALSSIVRRGSLELTTASGAKFSFGDGTGKPVEVRFATAAAQRAIMLDPELRLGEAYMDGTFIVERGTISDFLEVMLQNMGLRRAMPFAKALVFLRKVKHALFQWNIRSVARKNAKHHYDVDFRIYRLFLDPDLQYSCAYYEKNDYTLEQAQAAKKRHIAAKLLLKPGQRILDIGCGWGGMGLYLARSNEARVTGVTLSKEQLAVARARTADEGLTETVDFRLQDYRDVSERYDRIVSVGMFEHVGPKHYRTFFRKCFDLLDEDGVMLLHTVGRYDPPSPTNAWVANYIFPGGHAPSYSELASVIEQSGFIMTDLEVLRLHYAKTLAAWRDNFLANRQKVLEYADEKFLRMWEFYLSGFEASFRHYGLVVFQIQLAKSMATVPITRDYIYLPETRKTAFTSKPNLKIVTGD
jgi:cyclopropane-fatty-acyl-phospholipid synthase